MNNKVSERKRGEGEGEKEGGGRESRSKWLKKNRKKWISILKETTESKYNRWKETTLRHSIVKFHNTEDQKKIVQAFRKKKEYRHHIEKTNNLETFGLLNSYLQKFQRKLIPLWHFIPSQVSKQESGQIHNFAGGLGVLQWLGSILTTILGLPFASLLCWICSLYLTSLSHSLFLRNFLRKGL